MSKIKSPNSPKAAFLSAVGINIIIFASNWEPVVQDRAKTAVEYFLRVSLYVIGVIAFCWSYSVAKQKKVSRWRALSQGAIILGIAWLAFIAFVILLGYFWAKAWESSNLQF